MAMASTVLFFSLLLLCLFGTCFATRFFSELERTLLVEASPQPEEVLKVEEKIKVKWTLNNCFPTNIAEEYKKVSVKLCYAPISQKDRPWRKTRPELEKDKTCNFKMVERPFTKRDDQSFEYTIEKRIPTATYFIRAYVFNGKGQEVAFGQTTDDNKTTNLFHIQGISGRQASINISAGCLSGFSILFFFGVFCFEFRKVRNTQRNCRGEAVGRGEVNS